jgi:hypothetical protein
MCVTDKWARLVSGPRLAGEADCLGPMIGGRSTGRSGSVTSWVDDRDQTRFN